MQLFQKELWCVCGRATRTNNAAESSHATLNASVRVSGDVSLDMFLFTIEKQMTNTTREIEQGCKSHSKAIYTRRNQLLANDLSDLFNGKQGVFRFLDNCSKVMYVRNVADVGNSLTQKGSEGVDQIYISWAIRNRENVVNSAFMLHIQLYPALPKSQGQILGTVSAWAFQPDSCDIDTSCLLEDEVSLAIAEPNESFLIIRAAREGCEHMEDLDSTEEEICGIEEQPRVPCNVFCGKTYTL